MPTTHQGRAGDPNEAASVARSTWAFSVREVRVSVTKMSASSLDRQSDRVTWTTRRLVEGVKRTLTEASAIDRCGLRMEIVA